MCYNEIIGEILDIKKGALMVSKKERFAKVEDCLKELTLLLPAEGEVRVDSFSSENKERFYTLVSKYASFKQDPALKDVVENLETKYNVSGAFRSQVEDYINRRKEIVEKEKKEEIADREQQIVEDRNEKSLQEIAQERKLTLDELKKLAASLGVKLEELAKKHGSMEKAEAELIEMAKKDPKKDDLTGIYVAEVVAPQDQERFYARLPKDQQAKVRWAAAEHKKRMKNGAPRVFVPPVRPGMGYTVNRDATLPSGKLIRDVHGENWHEPYVAAANRRGEYNDARADYEEATQIFCSHTMGYSLSEKQAVLTEVYAGGKVTIGRMRDLGISEGTSNQLINVVNSARDPKNTNARAHDRSSKKTGEKPDNDTQAKPNDPVEVISLKNAEANRKKTQADVSLAQNSADRAGVDVAQTVARHAEENITRSDAVATVDNQLQQDDLLKGRA